MNPVPPETILASEAERLDDVKTAAGVTLELFSHFYLPLITVLAEAVQRLPLSSTYYRDEGGAFRCALISARVALQYAETQVFFPDNPSEERRILEPQCRFAAFAATLATVVATVAQNAQITTEDDKDEYHPLVSPVSLRRWLTYNPGAHLSWRSGSPNLNAAEAAAIAARFIPTGHLQRFDLRVSLMLFGSVAPQLPANGIESTLSRVVRQSLTKVLEHYAEADKKRYAPTENAISTSRADVDRIAASLSRAAEPEVALDIHTAAPTVKAGAGITLPASEQTPHTSSELGAKLIKSASPALQEWFKVLPKHEKYPAFKSHLKVTDRGVEVPATMLAQFGVGGPVVQKMLKDAGLFVDRTEEGRGVILHPALEPFLIVDQ